MVVTVKAEVETFEVVLRCNLGLVFWFWNSRRIFCDVQCRCVSLWDGDVSRFCSEFIQNFHKGEVYLIEENFVGEHFCHQANIWSLFPDEKFFSDLIYLT